jgi:dihydrolipoamide dehydrogenase
VREVLVAAGDQVSQGDAIVTLELEESDERVKRPSSASAEPEEPEEPEESEERTKRSTEGEASAEPAADLHAGLLVLGAGPGGYTAAFRAADLGSDVVLVERHSTLGGVCLNVGCIPSKALLHASKVIDEAAEMAERGIRFGAPEIDLGALRGWKDEVVGKLTSGLAALAKRRKVKVVRGTGTFTSPHTLEVESDGGETRTISFDAAIVAAGSRVLEIPGIPWDDPRVLDSTGALEIRDVPERLLIVGGGIIGLEMACVYDALGSKITVVELLDRLMPGADPDLVKPLRKRIEERYEAIRLETRVAKVDAEEEGLRVHFEGAAEGGEAPEPELFDRVLVAVGRRPNGDRIGAEAAGLEVDERGFLRVDEHQRTNVEHIFAIGDVVGQPLLAHKASHQGKVAAEVASGRRSAFDARVVPSVAYTDPEVAWAGVTEEEAKSQCLDYGKGTFPWSASGRSLGLGRDEGMTKLLFDRETNRVIGAGIVGPGAGDLIAEVALAIEMQCEASDVGLTVHPHPTLSETVAFAAEAFEGTLTELYKPKR